MKMINPAILPPNAHRYPFKYVEVMFDEETGAWLVLVFNREAYERAADNEKIKPIDAISAMDEVTAISRAKKEHMYIVIAKTSGEIKTTLL